MRFRLILATILSLPGLALVGCGQSASSSNATVEASNEPLSPADVAKAEEEMNRVADEERAQQRQNPVGKKSAQAR